MLMLIPGENSIFAHATLWIFLYFYSKYYCLKQLVLLCHSVQIFQYSDIPIFTLFGSDILILITVLIRSGCLEHNPLWFLLDPLSLPGLHDLQDGLSTLPRLWRELPYPLKFYLNYTDYQRVAWTAFSPHATCVAQLICVQSSVQLQSEKIVYMLHIYSCKLYCFNHLKSVCIGIVSLPGQGSIFFSK